MTYPYAIPGAQVYPGNFIANNTLALGQFDMSVDMVAAITVDYSQLVGPSGGAFTPTRYWFKIAPGGEPQLQITNPQITAEVLAFSLQGGIAGRSYEVTINMVDDLGGVRSDVLTVNVLGDDGACAPIMSIAMTNDPIVSSDGLVFINTAPRFFVSSTPPVNPRVLDRWYYTSTGDVYDYITDGNIAEWALAAGGGVAGAGTDILTLLPIVPDGTTRIFSLACTGRTVNVTANSTLFVSVDGVWQDPTSQYTALSNSITFNEAPTADAHVFMLWFAPAQLP